MYTEQAQEFEASNKLREAEQVLLAINEPDLAIAMYKRLELFDHMIRLVEKYHKDLLGKNNSHSSQNSI